MGLNFDDFIKQGGGSDAASAFAWALWAEREKKKQEKEANKLSIIFTPPKREVERRFPKFRRFRKNLKVDISSMYYSQHEKDITSLTVEREECRVPTEIEERLHRGNLLVLGFNWDGDFMYIKPRQIKREVVSLEKLLYMCIVESQYIQFEEL